MHLPQSSCCAHALDWLWLSTKAAEFFARQFSYCGICWTTWKVAKNHGEEKALAIDFRRQVHLMRYDVASRQAPGLSFSLAAGSQVSLPACSLAGYSTCLLGCDGYRAQDLGQISAVVA